MKDDEARLLTLMQTKVACHYEGYHQHFKPDDDLYHITAREVVAEVGINAKRAYYILSKWSDRRWYECGFSIALGWMTPEGMKVNGFDWSTHNCVRPDLEPLDGREFLERTLDRHYGAMEPVQAFLLKQYTKHMTDKIFGNNDCRRVQVNRLMPLVVEPEREVVVLKAVIIGIEGTGATRETIDRIERTLRSLPDLKIKAFERHGPAATLRQIPDSEMVELKVDEANGLAFSTWGEMWRTEPLGDDTVARMKQDLRGMISECGGRAIHIATDLEDKDFRQ